MYYFQWISSTRLFTFIIIFIFAFHSINCLFVYLYLPGSTEIYPSSCLERSESLVTGAEDCTDGGPKLKANTKQRITSDPVFYVNLTDEELEDVIAVDPEAASNELNKTIQEILLYQESCERELSRRSQLRDANELLKLYQRAKKKEEHHGNESVAKKSKVSQWWLITYSSKFSTEQFGIFNRNYGIIQLISITLFILNWNILQENR